MNLVKQAFTLIELLVVIAIIGILSGLIVVSMSGVTSKANIAKSQIFANSLRNSLLGNLTDEWKFNNNANDTWGGNNGSVAGAPTYKLEGDCVYGQCVELNGSGDFFNLTSSVSLTGEFTVTAWVYRDTNNTHDFIFGKSTNDCKIGLNSGDSKLFARIIAGSTVDNTGSDDVVVNKWHHIVVTRNSSNKVDSYIDAGRAKRLFSDVAQSGSFDIDRLGNDATNYFDGRLDEIAVYTATMPISQIRSQYYLGLNSLLTNGSISLAEYRERLSEIAWQ